MRRVFGFLSVALMAISPPALAQEQGGAVLIRGARVFDGTRTLGIRDVLVEQGRIKRVARSIVVPEGIPTVAGRGRTLMPGLIDSHVHVFPGAAADALRFGVTSEFDMFNVPQPGSSGAARARRESYAVTDQADVWSAGRGVTLPGAHPTGLARQQFGTELPTLAADGDAAAFVRAEVEEGSDYIKIFQDEASGPDGRPRFPKFSREQLGAIISAAHVGGRKAIVHVSSEADARQAFELGADGLAHVFTDRPASPETVGLVRRKRGTVIATLSVIAGASGDEASGRLAADPAIGPLLSPLQRGMISQRFGRARPEQLPNALESVRRLAAGGVVILAGTDAPNPTTAHGATMHQELELLVRAGLSPAQALAAATAHPAAFFGATDRGVIANGKRADLLLVEGDPTKDVSATRRIVGIWKNGYPVDRTKLPPMPPAPARP